MKNSMDGLRRLTAMRGVHFFVTRFGPSFLRKLSFDEKYISGSWGAFDSVPEVELARVVEKYCKNGHILNLGCGVAAVAGNLRPESFKSFHGVDLSEAAIGIASKRADEHITFATGDMLDHKFAKQYDVVLLAESINYIPRRQMEAQIKHLQSGLTPEGVLVVTIAEARRYDWIIQLLRERFKILEDRKFSGSERQLLVLR